MKIRYWIYYLKTIKNESFSKFFSILNNFLKKYGNLEEIYKTHIYQETRTFLFIKSKYEEDDRYGVGVLDFYLFNKKVYQDIF